MKTMLLNIALLTALIMLALSLSTDTIGQTVTSEIENVREFKPIPTEKGLIVLSREVKLKPDVDSKAFEKWINEYWNPEWHDLIPGFQSYIAKRDHEHDPNLYDYYLIFKAKNVKNKNYLELEENMDWYRELIYYKPTNYLYDELFEYIEIDPFFKNVKWMEVK